MDVSLSLCAPGVHAEAMQLTSETIEGAALALEGVDDVESSDGLTTSVLGVGDSVTDDVLKEDLEDTSGLLVDEAGDSLDAASSGQSPDGGLGDSLDVVSKDLSVPLGAALTETFASFSSAGHGSEWGEWVSRR